MMNEFDLITYYFANQAKPRPDVIVGIGDDAAITQIPNDHQLVITTDTSIAGVHFPENTNAYHIGYKTLAVNLSDLAAMGANPAWITLALTLPRAQEAWIQAFCEGFFTLANRHHVQLIGGDLTHGDLSITIQAMGLVPKGQAILRSGAKPSDLIYVSGSLGDAALGLQCVQGKMSLEKASQDYVMDRLNRPRPRLEMGDCLRGLASAAIDISDGLAADLGHILKQSRVGALVYVDKLPLSSALSQSLDQEKSIALALTGGDDYELCFTLPVEKRELAEKKLSALSCRYTCIGEIISHPSLDLRYQDGKKYNGPIQGYTHF